MPSLLLRVLLPAALLATVAIVAAPSLLAQQQTQPTPPQSPKPLPPPHRCEHEPPVTS